MAKKPGMSCEFNSKTREAVLYDANRNVVATSPHVGISTINQIFGVRNDFLGASVIPGTLPPNTPQNVYQYDLETNRMKEDGFRVDVRHAGGGVCDVELIDGRKFKDVPMKVVTPEPAKPPGM